MITDEAIAQPIPAEFPSVIVVEYPSIGKGPYLGKAGAGPDLALTG